MAFNERKVNFTYDIANKTSSYFYTQAYNEAYKAAVNSGATVADAQKIGLKAANKGWTGAARTYLPYIGVGLSAANMISHGINVANASGLVCALSALGTFGAAGAYLGPAAFAAGIGRLVWGLFHAKHIKNATKTLYYQNSELVPLYIDSAIPKRHLIHGNVDHYTDRNGVVHTYDVEGRKPGEVVDLYTDEKGNIHSGVPEKGPWIYFALKDSRTPKGWKDNDHVPENKRIFRYNPVTNILESSTIINPYIVGGRFNPRGKRLSDSEFYNLYLRDQDEKVFAKKSEYINKGLDRVLYQRITVGGKDFVIGPSQMGCNTGEIYELDPKNPTIQGLKSTGLYVEPHLGSQYQELYTVGKRAYVNWDGSYDIFDRNQKLVGNIKSDGTGILNGKAFRWTNHPIDLPDRVVTEYNPGIIHGSKTRKTVIPGTVWKGQGLMPIGAVTDVIPYGRYDLWHSDWKPFDPMVPIYVNKYATKILVFNPIQMQASIYNDALIPLGYAPPIKEGDEWKRIVIGGRTYLTDGSFLADPYSGRLVGMIDPKTGFAHGFKIIGGQEWEKDWSKPKEPPDWEPLGQVAGWKAQPVTGTIVSQESTETTKESQKTVAIDTQISDLNKQIAVAKEMLKSTTATNPGASDLVDQIDSLKKSVRNLLALKRRILQGESIGVPSGSTNVSVSKSEFDKYKWPLIAGIVWLIMLLFAIED